MTKGIIYYHYVMVQGKGKGVFGIKVFDCETVAEAKKEAKRMEKGVKIISVRTRYREDD